VSAWLAAAALVVSLGSLLLTSGRWFGRTDAQVRQLSDAQATDLARLSLEIAGLRAWRHKLGEEPYATAIAIMNQYEKRLDRLIVEIDKLWVRLDRRQRTEDP